MLIMLAAAARNLRPAGSVTSFKCSDAIKRVHIAWDAESLDKWLLDTDKFIPDNDMGFHDDRADERLST